MTLTKALKILARVHTEDDAAKGFVVTSLPRAALLASPYSERDYVQAWDVLRTELEKRHEREDV